MNSATWNRWLLRAARMTCVGLPLFLMWVLPLDSLYLTGGDEGIELTKGAYFARQGYWPVEVWNDQPLAHTRLYGWLLRWRPDPLGPRWWSIVTFAGLLVAVHGFTFHVHRDHAVALAAVVVLAWSPLVLDLSVAAMQEMPATALGMVSVWLVLRADEDENRWLLLMAVLSASAGIAIKLTAGFYAVAAFLLLLRRRCGGTDLDRRVERQMIGWPWWYALGVAVGCWLALWLLDGRPVAAHLASHWAALDAARRSSGAESAGPWMFLFGTHPFLWIFAVIGVSAALRSRRVIGGRCWDGFILVGVVALFHAVLRPWWEYYALTCWVGLVPIAAKGWVVSLKAWRGSDGRARSPEGRGMIAWSAAAGALAAGVFWGWAWLHQLVALRNSPRATDSRLLASLRQQIGVAPGGTIYSVEPIAAFWLGLRVPESLLVVSQKRFLSGDLDPAAIPGEVRRARCDYLVIPQGLDLEKLPDWPALLRESYILVAFAEGREIYVHRRWRPSRLETRMQW
ncbi:MAG: glycosyltransferase family 39 protein [Verrucomicrobiales bacterium]|nr:glycosyltransferase family 39 protein [Verrucomicrobiales bacterium]